MSQRLLSLAAAIILATLSYTEASMFNSQPKFILKAEKNKAFDNSSLVKTFNMKSGSIADCLEHCLEDCRCQSFQICQNTKCQLCSSHKEANSSLLHDKDGCVYAMYEMRQSTKTFHKLDKQCSDISCSMKYNCCQQSGLCPENKTCKPFNSPTKPWKRFICVCRDGYHGDKCDQPMRSCAGYLDPRRKSGIYTVVDSAGSEYTVYCLFDSDVAWTLLQSNSVANGSYSWYFKQFSNTLAENHPVGENALYWKGYRLRKSRMKSIKDNSALLQFTCDYEKHFDPQKSDYVQIPLENIKRWQGGQKVVVDVLELDHHTFYTGIGEVSGKMGGYDLNQCKIGLGQSTGVFLHVHIDNECQFNGLTCPTTCEYFRSYRYACDCMKQVHGCIQNDNSTTQLWFGTRLA